MAVAAVLAGLAAAEAAGESLRTFRVAGNGIPDPISASAGDAARGMQAAADRQRGNCILCHALPLEGAGYQGELAPDLSAVAIRLSAAQIRLRIVDSTRVNPETIMPAYYRVDGLNRVAAEFRGKPVLSAEEIEDVVAYLMSLR
ncbi:MAG: sulfur oxidation c-type cytochrome SoxX [Rhodospirillales bacterium]|nr:sulfur oxidation c-type cytochrome SoxX [Rhodospirillales bacterium]